MEEAELPMAPTPEVVTMSNGLGHSDITVSKRSVSLVAAIAIIGFSLIAVIQTFPGLAAKYRNLVTVLGALLASPTFFLFYFIYRIVLPPLYRRPHSVDDVDEEAPIAV